MSAVRVLVVTIVHDPRDSRIFARQIAAMLDAGWHVTYAAPFSATGAPVPQLARLRALDLPRAYGRRRAAAWRAARRLVRAESARHDLVLLHDPELVLATAVRGTPAVVWDVHEDTAGAIEHKGWLPPSARGVASAGARWLERWSERHFDLILAEHAYQDRFARTHTVVPNTVRVPPAVSASGSSTVVYVGSITRVRGGLDLIEVGRQLRRRTDGAVTLRLIGPADEPTTTALEAAVAAGDVRWDGRQPSDVAMKALDGALAGLSLLHDTANYRASLPTKVVEYMAHGVPVVTTPLPLAKALVERAECGFVVPFATPSVAVDAVLRLLEDPALRERMAASGRATAVAEFDWSVQSAAFLAELERVVAKHQSRRSVSP